MDIVSPERLHSCRAYFTGFDRVTHSQVAWTAKEVEDIKGELERQAKLAVLTKGHVVIAASHLLESELAHELLLGHPRLFSEGVIVPALRSEFPTVEAFREAKVAEGREADLYEGDEKRDIAQWIDETTKLAIQWRVEEASGWLKRRLVADLTSDSSLLSSQFRTRGVPVPSQLASQIEGMADVNRADVYRLAKATAGEAGVPFFYLVEARNDGHRTVISAADRALDIPSR